ncbi:type VI secretion system accessory protein TagJ [Aquabacterium sp.]|uniref:type VI secretion system accessory protein TagJ n=1 Tax=Aquabacterium sp. TaxID=1872578 RepID=UPI002CE96EE6|nr:type VI secretion system accessory protein TagJ [Aquabacterium sp.]HSW08715.1 type VI secretion system accessory protein TagJ [Aquabacterium sp.]
MPTAQELLAQGDPKGALAQLQQQVRSKAADPKLRVFLFQLLCVLGQWQRALDQLQVCGELDAGTLAMVNTYRSALQCEAVREAVFAGTTVPHAFGRPQNWVALLAQALQAESQGDAPQAAHLRAMAFEQAPTTSGSLDGQAFDWIADGDSRLGPVLEVIINGRYGWLPYGSLQKISIDAPTDLRDLVWAPALITFANGGETVALLPVRYAGTAAQADGQLLMSRKTEWIELAEGQYRGLGQRLLTTSGAEVGLLEAREILLNPEIPAEEEADEGDEAGAAGAASA